MSDFAAWTPALWHVLHTISFNYPVNPSRKTQRNYRLFMQSLAKIIKGCYKFDMKLTDFKSRRAFSKFVHRTRASVQACEKRPFKQSYESCRKQYECFRARCIKNPTENGKREKGCIYAAYKSVYSQVLIEPLVNNRRRNQTKVDRRCNFRLAQFTTEDFNSGSGMVTRTWGSPLWHVLHSIANRYPDMPTKTEQRNHYLLFERIRHVLPCCYCRDNYVENLRVSGFDPKHFESKRSLTRYVFDLHNTVNKCLGKPLFEKKYEDWVQEYAQILDGTHCCTISILPPGNRKSIKISKSC